MRAHDDESHPVVASPAMLVYCSRSSLMTEDASSGRSSRAWVAELTRLERREEISSSRESRLVRVVGVGVGVGEGAMVVAEMRLVRREMMRRLRMLGFLGGGMMIVWCRAFVVVIGGLVDCVILCVVRGVACYSVRLYAVSGTLL